ncbi:MAG: hypothetical protein WCC64_03435, partial [Aliidongia sp.]
ETQATQTETISPAREPRRRPNAELEPAAADAKGAQSRLASLLKQADSPPAPRPVPRAAPPAAAEPATPPPETAERPVPQSRAERDLLRALEGRR